MARDEIERGNVVVGGAAAVKASRLVAPDEALALARERPRYVSRGGEKLDHALTRFGISVAGRAGLDAGASTGGFTDCLLERGAATVIAVDVGHGQLHDRLRTDPRVHVLDRTNVRHLRAGDLPEARPVDVVVADLSFISLTTVAPVLVELGAENADYVLLVKPQFEVGRAAATKNRGVISDPTLWRGAVERVTDALRAAGAIMMSIEASPLLGAEGNAEFLVHVRKWDPMVDAATGGAFDAAIERAIIDALKLRQKAAPRLPAERG